MDRIKKLVVLPAELEEVLHKDVKKTNKKNCKNNKAETTVKPTTKSTKWKKIK